MVVRVVGRRCFVALMLVITSLGFVGNPASAAAPATFEELVQTPTLHRGHSEVLRLYFAVLDRTPEVDGAQFWLEAYDSGEWTTRRIAAFFAESTEFRATYGDDVANEDFVRIVYENVLDRAPDDEGFAFWFEQVEAGMSRAEMILLISNSPEFINRIPLPGDARADTGPFARTTDSVLAYFDGVARLSGSPDPALAAPDSAAEDFANYVFAVVVYLNDHDDGTILNPTQRTVTNTSVDYTPGLALYDQIRVEDGLVADFALNGLLVSRSMGRQPDPLTFGDAIVTRSVALQDGGSVAMAVFVTNQGDSVLTVQSDLAVWTSGGSSFTPPVLGTDDTFTIAPGQGRSFFTLFFIDDEGADFIPGTLRIPMSNGSGSFDAEYAID